MPVRARGDVVYEHAAAPVPVVYRREVLTMFTLDGSGIGTGPYLHVFNGPYVTVEGERRDIPDCCERLMVWLALRRSRVDRSATAGVLWPVVDDRRAAGNLRSALWRLRGAGLELVESNNTSLALRAEVTVDVHLAADWARRIIGGAARDSDVKLVPWFADALGLLSGWEDDWAILERERLRHRTLHAFEHLSRLFCYARRYAEGVSAARTVVAADPLRASAQYALIDAHLAAGDIDQARQVLDKYRRLHRDAFGVDALPRLGGLMSSRDTRNAERSSPAHLLSDQE